MLAGRPFLLVVCTLYYMKAGPMRSTVVHLLLLRTGERCYFSFIGVQSILNSSSWNRFSLLCIWSFQLFLTN
jgi:hypothetical protein